MLIGITLLAFALGACSPTAIEASDALPPGDVARGAALFTQIDGAPACATCHTLDGTPLVGPSLKGIAARASNRVEGQSAEEYIYTSIVSPSAYVVDGFSNSMYPQFARQLVPQEIADLIAYLLTL